MCGDGREKLVERDEKRTRQTKADKIIIFLFDNSKDRDRDWI